MCASRRGARSGGPSCDDPAHRPWVTSGGYKESPPGDAGQRCLSSGVVAEQASHTARGTPTQSAVRGDCNLMRFSHCAWGQGLAESPAFRAPLRYRLADIAVKKGHREFGRRARPRRPKNRDGGALPECARYQLRHPEVPARRAGLEARRPIILRGSRSLSSGRASRGLVGSRLRMTAQRPALYRIVARYFVHAAISPLTSAG